DVPRDDAAGGLVARRALWSRVHRLLRARAASATDRAHDLRGRLVGDGLARLTVVDDARASASGRGHHACARRPGGDQRAATAPISLARRSPYIYRLDLRQRQS